ncbi:MAG: 4Fe-4S binding protein [Treponema sp.]|nr:4Fe-4S binding protein [Treponema sp.]
MIVFIVLLIILVLVFSIIITFAFHILLPSIKVNPKVESADTLISSSERSYIQPEKRDFSPNDKKAIVLCSCNKKFDNPQQNFNEVHTCFMMKSMGLSGSDCKFACIGLGDCTKACSQEAISIINGCAVISDLCCGCGSCVDVCPQKIIKMIPKNTKTISVCSNHSSQELTSCSEKGNEINVEWKVKKDFKIWQYCYRILIKICNIFKTN